MQNVVDDVPPSSQYKVVLYSNQELQHLNNSRETFYYHKCIFKHGLIGLIPVEAKKKHGPKKRMIDRKPNTLIISWQSTQTSLE